MPAAATNRKSTASVFIIIALVSAVSIYDFCNEKRLERRKFVKSICALLTVLLSASSAAEENGAAEDAERIFKETCVACHGEGIRGAPRPGVKADWEPRLGYGIEDLYLNAVDGVGALMPPRGMCFDCSDSQLKAVVDFMVRDLK